ncbi:unnamed protein product [Closterium sp. NIES-53]
MAPYSSYISHTRFPRRLLPCRLSTWTCGAQPVSMDRAASATFCRLLTATRVTPRSSPYAARDLPILRLHFDRGGELSSDLLRDFYRGEGILQSFTLPTSPQQNGIAERHIGLVMEFYHPTSRRVLPSYDVMFDKSVSFYRLFPYRSAPLPPLPLFLAPCPPPVDPLPPQGRAPSGVLSLGVLSLGVLSLLVRRLGVLSLRVRGLGGAEPGGAEPGGAESEGAGFGSAEPGGSLSPRGPPSTLSRREPLSPPQLREWFARRTRLRSGVAGAGGSAAGDAGAAGARGAAVVGAGDLGAGGTGAGGAGPGGAGAVGAGSGDTGRPRSYFVPLLQQVLGLPSSTGLTPPLLCPPPDQSQPPLQPASPLPAPSPYTEQTRDPPPVPGMHPMALRPSSVPQRVTLPSPLASSLVDGPAPESDLVHAASPTVTRLLATVVTDPLFESAAASALVAELVDFAATCRLDYEDFECFAAAVPHLVSMLIAPEGDQDAPDIPTLRSYAEAITGTYVDAVPPPRANIVDGMWIFRRQGVDFFQTFSPTPKMTTLRVLLHVVAQLDYELHSLDFSTAFLQGSLHEEIWLHRPPGFTGSFPAGTQWSLRRPVYSLRQAPREWHDTPRKTLSALGFAPSTTDPSLFLRSDTSLPPLYVLLYVDDLVFATADTEALILGKSELQKRHMCTDLRELRNYLGLQITWDRARRTITLTQLHMVRQVLQRFGYRYSSPQSTPLPTGHSLSARPSDESVEPSGTYPELVGCLISSCEAEIYGGAMAAQELRWLTYLLTDSGEWPRFSPVRYVDNKAIISLYQEHKLEHRTKHIALRYFLNRKLQQRGQLRLAYMATRANIADIFTKALHSACFAFLDWSCDHLFSPTLPMGVCQNVI